MEATAELWSKHLNHSASKSNLMLKPSVMFTTESKAMQKDHQNFMNSTERQAQFPYQFEFITNTKDVTPDTGKLKRRHIAMSQTTADEAMISSMSSLQAQMNARVTLGNCCSNYHVLLSDYLTEGCGSASENLFMCLQESENPYLRVCCGWSGDCKEKKALAIAELENRTALTSPG